MFCVKAIESIDKLGTHFPKLPVLFKDGDMKISILTSEYNITIFKTKTGDNIRK